MKKSKPVFEKGGIHDGWAILIAIAYLPIIYKIHMRLTDLEDEVSTLKGKKIGDR
jgi:hypothetical protein